MNIHPIYRFWLFMAAFLLTIALISKPGLDDFREFVPGEVNKSEQFIKKNVTVSKDADYILVARYKMYNGARRYSVTYNAYLGNFFFADSKKEEKLTHGELNDL